MADRVEVLPDPTPAAAAPAQVAPAPAATGDNIAPSVTQASFSDAAAATQADAAAPATPPPPPEFYNLTVALQMISANYERDFPKLSFNTPHQIVDGSVAEFIDTSMGVTVATARIRIRNRLVVNNENGELSMVVHLSDMTFARPSVNLSVTRK